MFRRFCWWVLIFAFVFIVPVAGLATTPERTTDVFSEKFSLDENGVWLASNQADGEHALYFVKDGSTACTRIVEFGAPIAGFASNGSGVCVAIREKDTLEFMWADQQGNVKSLFTREASHDIGDMVATEGHIAIQWKPLESERPLMSPDLAMVHPLTILSFDGRMLECPVTHAVGMTRYGKNSLLLALKPEHGGYPFALYDLDTEEFFEITRPEQ